MKENTFCEYKLQRKNKRSSPKNGKLFIILVHYVHYMYVFAYMRWIDRDTCRNSV